MRSQVHGGRTIEDGVHDREPDVMNGGSDARTPYRVLMGVQLLAATFALLFAIFPTASDELRRLDLLAALVLGLGSLFTWYVAPRLADGWGMDIVLGTISVIAIVGAAVVPDATGLILVGYGFVLVSTFAAYFRPRNRYVGHLVVLIVGYAVAIHLNPVEARALDTLVVAVITAVVSGLVAFLAGRLRDQTLRDPLTGAFNRRGLDLLAPSVLAGATRAGSPVTIGVIDLDSFHAFNQVHGHVAGDELLARIADSWQERLRASDLLVRYGGDEFVVVLPGTRADEARRIATRVRAHHPAAWTVGFIEWSPSEGLYAAIDRADAEMFRHKRGPRRIEADQLPRT
jgi:GGDEF domain-containing protein